jgi:hypothetical protein
MNGDSPEFVAYESRKPLSVGHGFYGASVKAVEPVTGKFGDQLRFTFALDNSDEEAWAWSSAKCGTATKLWKWATALGHPPVVGQPFKVQSLVGARARVAVQEKADADGNLRSYVADVLRAEGPVTAGPAPKQAESDPTPDRCFCGQVVYTYAEDGRPLCEKHAAEAEPVPA